MFSGRHQLSEIEGRIFVDRDPDLFKLMINYIRNGGLTYNQEEEKRLEIELKFWSIDKAYFAKEPVLCDKYEIIQDELNKPLENIIAHTEETDQMLSKY